MLRQKHFPLDHPNHMLIKLEKKIGKKPQGIYLIHLFNTCLKPKASHGWWLGVGHTERTYGKWR